LYLVFPFSKTFLAYAKCHYPVYFMPSVTIKSKMLNAIMQSGVKLNVNVMNILAPTYLTFQGLAAISIGINVL